MSGLAALVTAPAGLHAGRTASLSRADIIEVDEIKPGMKGYGLSVWEGTEPERFEVEVIAVIPNAHLRQDMILVRCSGRDLDKTMVIAGMSGSPIYIEDRLAGSLSYGWSFSREPIAGLTPIRNMIVAADKYASGPLAQAEPKGISPETTGLALAGPEDSALASSREETRELPSTAAIAALATPLLVSGLSPASMEFLTQELAPYNLVPVTGGGFHGTDLDRTASASLKPGDAVGAALMTGDISMVAVGTLTWREGDDIIAFGHPFLGVGPISMPLVAAEIHTVVSTLQLSMKIGTPTAVVGELVGDELPGIMGRLGVQPETIPLKVRINRPALHYQDEFNLRLAANPQLTPILVKAALMEIIASAAPAFGPTTVCARTSLQLAGYGPVQYEDEYAVSKGNFSAGFLDPVMFFASNPFEKVRLDAADIELTIRDELKAAAIESVWASSDEVQPGTTVEIGVVLRPYNEEPLEYRFQVPVPPDLAAKTFKIKISGGNKGEPDAAAPRTVSDMIAFMGSVHKSTRLVVAYNAPGRSVDVKGQRLRDLPPSVSSLLTPRNDTETGEAPLLVVAVKDTPYVIVGVHTLTLAVKGASKDKE
jgi:hypothetical protein